MLKTDKNADGFVLANNESSAVRILTMTYRGVSGSNAVQQ